MTFFPLQSTVPWRQVAARKATALLLWLISSTTGARAQGVTGVVAEVRTAERIRGADVMLFDGTGQRRASTGTGEAGEFLIQVPEPGVYVLLVHQAGYKDRSAELVLKTGELLEVRVNLAPAATELEGVTVYGLTATAPEHREFLSRRHLPWNYSFDMLDIERMHAASVWDVVRFGGVLIPPGRCMMVFLDGLPSNLSGPDRGYDSIPIGWVYGIEVYRDFFDVPIEYRDAIGVGGRVPQRCGAILLWSKHPPGVQPPHVWSMALGGSAGLERALIELGWMAGNPRRYVTVVRIRGGEFKPYDLLGTEKALEQGFDPEQRPLFGSVYLGRQGPAPITQWRNVVFARLAAGASVYGGQAGSVTGADATRTSVSPFLGLGVEFAVGVRGPDWKVRPWLEVRSGTEYLTRTGLRWLVPTVMFGVEFGAKRN